MPTNSTRKNIISVIITTYNQESTIARTLDSVLAQRCQWPIEIVLGEDCSTDGTRDICRQYAEKHADTIRLFANERNKGVIDNYFNCLLQCKGKYIADCAGDDFWTDEYKLQKQLEVMEAHPEVTIAHTEWLYYDETTNATTTPPPAVFTRPLTDGKLMLPAIITQTNRPVVHLCTSLYRAETILKAYHDDTFMFRNKEFGCEDLQITAALANAGVVAYIPDITLNYSVGHSSVSAQPDDRRQFAFVESVTSLSHYLAKKYNVSHEATQEYFTSRLFALTMHAFRAEDKQLLEKVDKCQTKWNAKANLKQRLLRTLLRSQAMWKILLAIRKIVVGSRIKH